MARFPVVGIHVNVVAHTEDHFFKLPPKDQTWPNNPKYGKEARIEKPKNFQLTHPLKCHDITGWGYSTLAKWSGQEWDRWFWISMRKLDLCVKNLDLCVENLVKSVGKKSVKKSWKKVWFFSKILQSPFTGPYYSLAKTLQIDLKIQTFYICTFSRFSILTWPEQNIHKKPNTHNSTHLKVGKKIFVKSFLGASWNSDLLLKKN